MPSLSAFAAAVLLALIMGLSLGFGGAYKMYHGEIQAMELSINTANQEAKDQLTAAQNRIKDAETKQLADNQNLDEAHNYAIKTIGDLRDSIATVQLRDPGSRKSSSSSVPASHSTGITQAETGTGELSAELTNFLQIKFYAADEVAEYANACYAFVVEKNCGILKQGD